MVDREFCIEYIKDDCKVCPECDKYNNCTSGSHCFEVKSKIILDLRKMDKLEQIMDSDKAELEKLDAIQEVLYKG